MNGKLQPRRLSVAISASAAPHLWALAVLFALLAPAPGSRAEGGGTIAGAYVCEAGCRVTDAAPSVEISGSTARCMNELGGIFIGEALGDGSIACFHKIGRLSPDGRRVLWDSGMIWRRLPDRQD